MGMKLRLALLACCLLMAAGFTSAGEPGTFQVSQAALHPPEVELYVDVLDQNGQPPANLSRSDFSASLLGQALKVKDVGSFESSGQGVAYIFLVDISKSILRPQFAEMRGAIDHWIDGLDEKDRMAVLTFGDGVKTLVDFTGDKSLLKSALQTVEPSDLKTRLYLALNDAENLNSRSDPGLPNRRVVVIVSDGKDEGSGFTDTDIRALVAQVHMPIYAIGSSRLPLSEREQHLAELKRLALLSGGEYTTGDPLTAAFNQLKQAIQRVFIVAFRCDGCQYDTADHPLILTLATGNNSRTAQLPVKLLSIPPVPWWKDLKISIPVSIGFALAVGGSIYLKFFRKGKPASEGVKTSSFEHKKTGPPPLKKTGKLIRLTIVSGRDHGRVYEVRLAGTAVIGRDASCDASFPDDSEMSARHCEVIEDGSRIELEDQGSTNGTLLNGARLVGRQKLSSGDLVRAGRTEFRINFGEA
jgi:VWFA-related protein